MREPKLERPNGKRPNEGQPKGETKGRQPNVEHRKGNILTGMSNGRQPNKGQPNRGQPNRGWPNLKLPNWEQSNGESNGLNGLMGDSLTGNI